MFIDPLGLNMICIESFNRVPSGPRSQRPAGGIPKRGAMPTRLNECVNYVVYSEFNRTYS